MNQYSNKKTDAGDIVEAEKGNNLSPRNLHLRLRVMEFVAVVSLILNLLHWYVSGVTDKKIQDNVDTVAQRTGVQQ